MVERLHPSVESDCASEVGQPKRFELPCTLPNPIFRRIESRHSSGGATDTGPPYFVMELVRGKRITDTFEVFGELDRDFMVGLESLLRTPIVGFDNDVQEKLRRECEKREQQRVEMEQLDQILAALPNQIIAQKKLGYDAALAAVEQADQLLRVANEELDKAVNALLAVSGKLGADLANAQNVFRTASSALSFTQGGDSGLMWITAAGSAFGLHSRGDGSGPDGRSLRSFGSLALRTELVFGVTLIGG